MCVACAQGVRTLLVCSCSIIRASAAICESSVSELCLWTISLLPGSACACPCKCRCGLATCERSCLHVRVRVRLSVTLCIFVRLCVCVCARVCLHFTSRKCLYEFWHLRRWSQSK